MGKLILGPCQTVRQNKSLLLLFQYMIFKGERQKKEGNFLLNKRKI